MSIHITPQDSQLVLHEEAAEIRIGDQVEFTLTDWHEGDIRISGEVTRLFEHGRCKVRVADASFSVPVTALQMIERRAA
jgi:hypothetical protein